MAEQEPDTQPAEEREVITRFAKDRRGRTLFYPNGPSWAGYIVPDTAREKALQEAATRHRDGTKRWRGLISLLMIPFLAGFYALIGSHPFLAFAFLLVVPISLCAVLEWIVRRYMFGALVDGLEGVPAANISAPRLRLQVAGVVIAVGVLSWLILHLYDGRIGALSQSIDTVSFYPDISMPVVLAMLFCPLALLIATKWGKLTARFGEARLFLSIILLATLGLVSFGWAAADLLNPKPSIVLTPESLVCKERVRWLDVTGVQLRDGSRGKEYARLDLDPARLEAGQWSSSVRKRGAVTCEVTGLNVNYSAVYQAIQDRWQARGKPNNDSSPTEATPRIPGGPPDEAIQKIPVGATKSDVLATLSPVMKRETNAGEVFYYMLPGSDSSGILRPTSDGHVIAVYFNWRGRVERLAKFQRVSGKFTDAITGEEPGNAEEASLILGLFILMSRHKS
jgi:hypothetical protein